MGSLKEFYDVTGLFTRYVKAEFIFRAECHARKRQSKLLHFAEHAKSR